MLKKYEERKESVASQEVSKCAVVTIDGEDEGGLPLLGLRKKEDSRDVAISTKLTYPQREEARRLTAEFHSVFSDLPGRTDLAECRLELSTTRPVNIKQYFRSAPNH